MSQIQKSPAYYANKILLEHRHSPHLCFQWLLPHYSCRNKEQRETPWCTYPKTCPLTFYRKGFLPPVLYLKLICVYVFLFIMCVRVYMQVYMFVGIHVCGLMNVYMHMCVAIRGHS